LTPRLKIALLTAIAHSRIQPLPCREKIQRMKKGQIFRTQRRATRRRQQLAEENLVGRIMNANLARLQIQSTIFVILLTETREIAQSLATAIAIPNNAKMPAENSVRVPLIITKLLCFWFIVGIIF
jgi:hypothetical protein